MAVSTDFAADEAWALAHDAADPLASFRGEFLIPPHGAGEQVYLCGNSLGLQPRATRQALIDELDDWAALAVEAIRSARAATTAPLQVIVVDNSVDRREADVLRAHRDILLPPDTNLGYAGGITAARAPRRAASLTL